MSDGNLKLAFVPHCTNYAVFVSLKHSKKSASTCVGVTLPSASNTWHFHCLEYRFKNVQHIFCMFLVDVVQIIRFHMFDVFFPKIVHHVTTPCLPRFVQGHAPSCHFLRRSCGSSSASGSFLRPWRTNFCSNCEEQNPCLAQGTVKELSRELSLYASTTFGPRKKLTWQHATTGSSGKDTMLSSRLLYQWHLQPPW